MSPSQVLKDKIKKDIKSGSDEFGNIGHTDEDSNRFNIKAALFVTLVLLFLWIMNLMGLFVVSHAIFAQVAISDIIILTVTYLASRVMGYENNATKYILLVGMCIQCSVLYIFLSYQAVISLIFPLIFAALYRKTSVMWFTYGVNSVCICISTVLAYKYGLADANTALLTWSSMPDFIANYESYSPVVGTPYLNLLAFYALPRCLVCMAIIPVLLHITVVIDKQTTKLFNEQKYFMELNKKQQEMQHNVIVSLSTVIENRDSTTGKHIHNTERYVKFLTDKLREHDDFREQLDKEYANLTVNAAPLHDVGKIKIPDSILCKPGKLTSEEYEQIKRHSEYGKEIVEEIVGEIGDTDYLEAASEMALHHHERYDGNGYPDGLAGEEIPLRARIMAVADVLDAVLSKRQYKDAFPPEKAKEIMGKEGGRQFDPIVLDALLNNWNEFLEIINSDNHSEV